jgi:Cas10/Cmr2, second palm domain
VDAYATTLSRRFDDGTALLSVPAAPELPLLAPCQRCRLDPAVAQVRGAKEEGTVNVCTDCAQRELAGGRRTRPAPGHPSPGLAAEERLSRLVAGDEALDWVDDFGALAKLTGERDNHLATVLADGNSMGRFFQRLAASGSPAKRTLSRRFAEATFQALAEATVALRPESGPLPVIPHVVGGDDVVVSLPARLAWPFLRGYLRAFERLVREAVKATAPGFAAETPTASAAVVFAHHTYPFQRCVTVGDELLAGAKTREAGARSSVLWVDVTREGEQPPASRRPWTIEELARLQDDIAMLAPGRLAKHARSALALGLARPDPDVAAARARLLAERLGVRDVVRRLLHDGDDGVGGVGRLGDALELGRWWP